MLQRSILIVQMPIKAEGTLELSQLTAVPYRARPPPHRQPTWTYGLLAAVYSIATKGRARWRPKHEAMGSQDRTANPS